VRKCTGMACASATTLSTLHLPGAQNLHRPQSSTIAIVRSAIVMQTFLLSSGSKVFLFQEPQLTPSETGRGWWLRGTGAGGIGKSGTDGVGV
jgi:hypothetical protein